MVQKRYYRPLFLLLFALLLVGCTGKKNTPTSIDFSGSYSKADINNAQQVITYYENSIALLKSMVPEKDINAIIAFMDKGDVNTNTYPSISLPAISEEQLAALMNPGACFDTETRETLKLNYAYLFEVVLKFHKNYDYYLSNASDMTSEQKWENDKLANQLGLEISEYKQQIYDALAPAIDDAFFIVLENSISRKQTMLMKQMDLNMLSILNLYARKGLADGRLIDKHADHLQNELDQAKQLKIVGDDDTSIQLYLEYLQAVDLFLNQTRLVRQDIEFSEDSYDMLSSAYATAVI